jgi:DNA-binding response OmpR family regulator
MNRLKRLRLKERIQPGLVSAGDGHSQGQQRVTGSGELVLFVKVGKWDFGALVPLIEQYGYRARVAQGYKDALMFLEREHPGLLVVGGSAESELYRSLRRVSRAHIFALAPWNDERQMLEAFAAGVDDYQGGYVGSREFVARARALLRRASPAAMPTAAPAL